MPALVVQILMELSDILDVFIVQKLVVVNMLNIAMLLSVNLGILNLLPIPALDGGRVFFLLVTTAIEAVTKKKIDPKYEGYIHAAGMVLLLGFMAVILFKDVFTIFTR